MNYTAAVITVSDSCSAGTRQDTSGPRVCAMVEQAGYQVIYTAVVPDDPDRIQNALVHCADILRADLILTTGGTGLSPRDVTPEATRAVVDREIPAIPQAMLFASLQITPRAMLSRAAAGIRKGALIVNLPGSPKAVRECLEFILPSLAHGLEILKGTAGNCASPE